MAYLIKKRKKERKNDFNGGQVETSAGSISKCQLTSYITPLKQCFVFFSLATSHSPVQLCLKYQLIRRGALRQPPGFTFLGSMARLCWDKTVSASVKLNLPAAPSTVTLRPPDDWLPPRLLRLLPKPPLLNIIVLVHTNTDTSSVGRTWQRGVRVGGLEWQLSTLGSSETDGEEGNTFLGGAPGHAGSAGGTCAERNLY